MTKKTIKIVFDVNPSADSLTFDRYEGRIFNELRTKQSVSRRVNIKYPMPISEFESIIRELQEKISYKYNCNVDYCLVEKCSWIEDSYMFVSAVYILTFVIN